MVRLEKLGQLKNPMISTGFDPRDLPACGIMLQPNTLLRAKRKILSSANGSKEKSE
jgi:hypothetical protein